MLQITIVSHGAAVLALLFSVLLQLPTGVGAMALPRPSLGDAGLYSSLTNRVILHIDMDAFYAQVEHERTGIARHEPLAVQQWEGLIAVNYAARAKGITRHMKAKEAKALCPELHCVHVQVLYTDGPEGEVTQGEASGRLSAGRRADEQDQGAGLTERQPDRSEGKVSLERYRTASADVFEALAPFGVVEKASVDEVLYIYIYMYIYIHIYIYVYMYIDIHVYI